MRKRKAQGVEFPNGARRLPRTACWSLLVALPVWLAACGSDAERAPPHEGDAGSSSGGEAGVNSRAGSAGKSGSGVDAGAAGESASDAGAAGEVGSAGAANGGQGGSSGNAGSGSQPPSCRAGNTLKCGLNEESCCASPALPGQTFYRGYDNVTPQFKSMAYPAAVTSLRLDKFEVTVGRFRQFVAAAIADWRPDAGGGKHSHLSDGKGLANIGAAGGYESGWDEAWSTRLDGKAADWNKHLACDQASASWTPTAGSKEMLPIACVNWYEAYAFCIWDEAFLPSEAEWNGAASAGPQQRVYPWSDPPSSTSIDCAHANFLGATGANGAEFCISPGTGSVNVVGGQSPLGDGRWGHADLAGNVYEWTLDSYADYTNACPDCVNSEDLENKVMRGGGYANDASAQLVAERAANPPAARSTSLGFRCARPM